MEQQAGTEIASTFLVSYAGDLFDRVGQGVVSLDAGLTLTHVNKTASRLLQKKQNDLVGQPLNVVIPGALGARLLEMVLRSQEEKIDSSFEEYHPFAQDHLLNIRCLPSDEGVFVIFRDVTGENHRQKSLGESEALARESGNAPTKDIPPSIVRASGCTFGEEPDWSTLEVLQAILDNVPSGLVVADRSGKIILASEAANEIFGGPPTGTAYGPAGGYQLLTLDGSPFPPEELPLPRVLQGEESVSGVEILVRRSDGSQVVMLASARPLRDHTGAVTGAITVFQDITERKRIEDSLRESERLFRIMGETVPYGVWLCEPHGGVRYCSQSFLDLLNLTQEEQQEFAWTKRLVPEDVEPMMKKWLGCCETGSHWEHEHRIIDRHGDIHTILSKGLPVRDSQGRISCWVGVNLDITERKKTEEALRKSEERLRLAQQAGGVGIFDWDIRADRTYWFDESKKIFGIAEDSTRTSEYWKKLIHPDDMGRARDKIAQAILERRSEVEGEYRIVRPNGDVRWISSRGMISYDDSGRPVRMIGTAIDITELKNAQDFLEKVNEALEQKVKARTRELEEANRTLRAQKEELQSTLDARRKMERDMLRLTTAMDQAGEGIVLFSTDWIIEYVNPAYERMVGYSREDLVGKGVDVIKKDSLTDCYPEIPHAVAARGEIWSGNARRKRKSGEVIDVHLTVSPVRDRTAKIINYVSVLQDITQQIRFQHMVAQSQKLEAIGTLAGGISHDLKNIFTPILINSEIAVEDVGRDNPAYPLLEEIHEAAKLGVDLVRQIMTFTRQTSDEKVPVDILPVVKETLSLLRAAIPKTIGIRTRFYAGNLKVQANPTQIKQVLMNLGSNAAYAMRGQRGLLEVNVSLVDLDKDSALSISPDLASGSYVEMAVRDTGEGMDEETLQRIFDPFFTTKQPGEGTGMGLSVVQGIVKDYQGALSAWSKPGQGSVFRVLLPRLKDKDIDRKQVQ